MTATLVGSNTVGLAFGSSCLTPRASPSPPIGVMQFDLTWRKSPVSTAALPAARASIFWTMFFAGMFGTDCADGEEPTTAPVDWQCAPGLAKIETQAASRAGLLARTSTEFPQKSATPSA